MAPSSATAGGRSAGGGSRRSRGRRRARSTGERRGGAAAAAAGARATLCRHASTGLGPARSALLYRFKQAAEAACADGPGQAGKFSVSLGRGAAACDGAARSARVARARQAAGGAVDTLHAGCQEREEELYMSSTAHKMATHASAAATGARGRRPPSVVREIVYGMSLGIFAGYLWKLHHWSNQRRTREFYSLLDQGKITVVVDEPPSGAAED